MSPDERAVLAANAAFYEAFSERDLVSMEELWSESRAVACVHPGWTGVVGREAVLASWRSILEAPSAPVVVCAREQVFVVGEVAFVLCVESIQGGNLLATNVFVREGGRWRMVHHHAGPIAAGADADAPPGLLN